MGAENRITLRRAVPKDRDVAFLQDSTQLALNRVSSRLDAVSQDVTNITVPGTSYLWNYFDKSLATLPAASTVDPAFVYAFNGGSGQLSDLSGNGNDLTAQAGTMFNAPIDGQLGAGMDETYWLKAPADSSLEMDRELSLEIVFHYGQVTSTEDFLIGYGTSSDSGAPNSNALYSLIITADKGQLWVFAEYSTGSNISHVFESYVPTAGYTYAVLTRDSTGLIYNLYLDGILIATWTASNAPDKGTGTSTKILAIGANYTTSLYLNGCVMGARGTAEEWSADMIAEVYSKLRGNA